MQLWKGQRARMRKRLVIFLGAQGGKCRDNRLNDLLKAQEVSKENG